MIPLKVALVIKDNQRQRLRDLRPIGLWSYPVPEFEWIHHTPGKYFRLDRAAFRQYDVIVNEEGAWGTWVGNGPPVVYICWDSNWTKNHLDVRVKQAAQADLVLIGHDALERFRPCGQKVRRLLYCVNDKVFFNRGLEKSVDVCYHCYVQGSPIRKEFGQHLARECARLGFSYANGGIPNQVDYARAFNSAKISMNLPRVPANRPHRVLDAMACRSCMVTGTVPEVSGDYVRMGEHFTMFDSKEEAVSIINELLRSGRWEAIADAGYEMVQQHYTWSIRAMELRELLNKELGL